MAVLPEQQKKFYDEHTDRYREVQAKLIYIPFSWDGGENEAKSKAEKVVQQARGGVDFLKLVKYF